MHCIQLIRCKVDFAKKEAEREREREKKAVPLKTLLSKKGKVFEQIDTLCMTHLPHRKIYESRRSPKL